MANLLSKYIVPGRRVELRAIRRSSASKDGERRKSHQCQVIDIISEDRIELTMPMEKGKLILLPIDGEYDMYFSGSGVLYQCSARVVDRYKNHNMYVLVMDLTSNLRKHQRREYYRFSCALEMNCRQLEEEELAIEDGDVEGKSDGEEMTPELPLKSSIIVDISGGGLRFVANYVYDVQSVILCKYHLMVDGRIKEFNLKGKVLDVREVENRQGVYEHRVQYIDMDAEEREEIIKYIFDEERRALRNTKGDLRRMT